MTDHPVPSSLNGHIDRLRGLFALFVVLGHVLAFAAWQNGVFAPWYERVHPYVGFAWVVGFIVLSGYCIAGSCAKATHSTPHGYVMLRLSRLFPMLWVCVAATAFLEAIMRGSPARSEISASGIDHGTMIANALGLGAYKGWYGSLSPAWTLSFELVFYALWGVAWFASGRRPRVAILLGAAGGAGLGVAVWNSPTLQRIPFAWFTLILYGCWLLGAALAFNIERIVAMRWTHLLSHVGWLPLLAVLAIGVERYQMPGFDASRVAWVYYPVLALTFAVVVVGLAAKGETVPHRVDRWLGNVSYPLYLGHGPTITFVAYLIALTGGRPPFVLYVLALCAAAVVVSIVLWLVVERPIMWLRRWARSTERRPVWVPATRPALEAVGMS